LWGSPRGQLARGIGGWAREFPRSWSPCTELNRVLRTFARCACVTLQGNVTRGRSYSPYRCPPVIVSRAPQIDGSSGQS